MKASSSHPAHRSHLYPQLCWFIRLRWLAALAVIAGAALDVRWLHWYAPHDFEILSTGLGILGYNVLLFWLIRTIRDRTQQRRVLLVLAWVQLLLDLGCLSLLTLWTGGVLSPLTPFFVLHMVFASLLLPRAMAYGGAAMAIVVYIGALKLGGHWPGDREQVLLIVGRAIALVVTVHLANYITRSLRAQRRRLIRQNRRIRAMTRQLKRQQQAMIQHEKMVAVGQMAAGVTHEIANPLASMDSLLQLMQRTPDRSRPDALNTLREQIGRINQIIQQMKRFAHPTELDCQTANLNDVVEEALRILRFDPRLKSIKIERQFASNVGSFTFVPQALQQVLVNLITNAVDAMAQTSEPRLTIRTSRKQGWYFVDVIDNGSGIADDHMRRLFEPFFTTKPIGKGTGLGLSISYSLIEKQGGRITVSSQVGKGTVFTIRLPAAAEPSRKREALLRPDAVSEKSAW